MPLLAWERYSPDLVKSRTHYVFCQVLTPEAALYYTGCVHDDKPGCFDTGNNEPIIMMDGEWYFAEIPPIEKGEA